ncbi:MAG: hypothetical protein JXB15_16020 [Anaerolineales bacterium]|nr:hypothetical protein [Anaerolineales bacterium]
MAHLYPNQLPAADEWNDSLKGDFLWTNSNFCEAISDVMTPATRSMWDIYMDRVRVNGGQGVVEILKERDR